MKLEKCLTEDNVNKNLFSISYAVRGRVPERAQQLERELAKGASKPFTRVLRANVGDCHALGQEPITFIRQVLALVSCPQLTTYWPDAPSDVRHRAAEILRDCTRGSVGSYSAPGGLALVRRHVAEYLQQRDAAPAAPEDIYLGSGASDLIKSVLTLFVGEVDGKPPAVMLPIPQYPLFSGTLSELGIEQAPYYLDEDHDWALSVDELERSWQEASERCRVRALVVINPGNPTGQVLSRENVEQIIKFAHRHGLLLLADEVYQENIISKPFHSFKKVMHELGPPYCDMELASFMTCSKGWAAECGLRSGCLELTRVCPSVRAVFEAARGVMQCPTVLGQCVLDCVVRPPRLGDASYMRWSEQRIALARVLAERAQTPYKHLNAIPGYSCNPIEGGMFAFPRVEVPALAQQHAAALHLPADDFYCLSLLEETGICVVPGNGFGQRAGTFHFRTTILHSREEFQYMMDSLAQFHIAFLRKYS